MKTLLKKDPVLFIAMVLSIFSSFAVPPNMGYLNYIDFRTLILLFCFMAVMEALKGIGAFERLSLSLLSRAGSRRLIVLILVFLSFFSSMLLTNDVALITFVPLAFISLERVGMRRDIGMVVVLMTIGANLWSALTPVGNPQNLYLYSIFGLGLMEFLKITFPIVGFSGIIIFVGCLLIKNGKIDRAERGGVQVNKSDLRDYLIVFAVCLLCVIFNVNLKGLIFLLILVLGVIIIKDKKVLKGVDYSLLLTFTFFFIFVGNISKIEAFNSFLKGIIDGREAAVAIVSSQVISNVPAALLLSGFTDNIKGLIIGTNVGGLGTLIASMASLISYKLFVKAYPEEKGSYLKIFTVYNIIGLALLLLFLIIC